MATYNRAIRRTAGDLRLAALEADERVAAACSAADLSRHVDCGEWSGPCLGRRIDAIVKDVAQRHRVAADALRERLDAEVYAAAVL